MAYDKAAHRTPPSPHAAPMMDGEVGALMRSRDWTGSPLGPPESWPQSLVSVVGLMLGSKFPMFIAWGDQLGFLYNDAYSAILGTKHPQALGRPFREVWSEIWPDIEPLVDAALAGVATYYEDLPLTMNRRGFDEQTWFSFSYSPVRDENGAVAGLFCACSETTTTVQAAAELRARELALAESEARFRNMADTAPVMMWVTDPSGWCTYLNARWYEFTGQAPGAGEGTGWLDAVHPEDRSAVEAAFTAANAEHRNYRVDFRLRRADGVYRWTIDAAAARFADSGEYLGYVGSVIDIDERREAEQALAASEERLRLATDHAEIGFWDVDVIRDQLIWPPRVKAMFGISADVPVTMADFYNGLHPADRAATADAFASACDPELRALYDVEYRTIGKEDGLVRWIAAKGRGVFEDGRCVRVVGTAIDITARKLAAARFEGVFNSDLMGFTIYDVNTGETLAINDHFLAMTGHSRADFDEGRWSWSDFTLAEHLVKDEAAIAQARAQGWWEPFEKEYRRTDGTIFPVRLASAPLPGDPGRVVLSVEDITERRQAEARLRELNDTLEQRVAERTAERDRMWRASRDLMCVARIDGTLLSVNPAWERVLGWTEAELVGRIAREIKHPDDAERTRAGLARLAAGEPVDGFEDRYLHKDGGWRWFSWSIEPAGELIYCAGRDITADKERQAELEQAQEALRQAQKMEAMGQLTGGVAHDFNNLLTPIVGSLDLLQRKGVGGEREQRMIAGAIQSAERAKTLVQRLLAFARRQPLQPTAVDVSAIVSGMADLIASTTGPQIRVAVEAAPDLPPARADANQLEMALLNLAVNARDAMPDGGTLRIAAVAETVDGTGSLAKGRYVRLSVSDTGIGMDEATAARAIEPFFSTKGLGKGTGLGLSMAHGLASQLGGELRIASRPKLGTNVELWLPVSDARPAADPKAESTAPARAMLGTALLVDDEDVVRMSTADMLSDLGYIVVETASAEEALARIGEGLAPDILVTDHLMPGMTGTELARAVRVERPLLPVLIVSGFAEVEGIAPDLPRLAKPFRQADLAARLADVLGTGKGPG